MILYNEIVIEWQKKKSFNECIKLLENNKNVVYQIYGDHHIYGRDTLLYIGQTQNLIIRLKKHLKGVFGFVNNITISVGIIKNFNDNIEIPESILIANHKPSYNKEFLHDLPFDAKKNKIIVINNGHNYLLNTCCTNYWWIESKFQSNS